MKITDLTYTKEILKKLLNTPSPSGFCQEAIKLIGEEAAAMGLHFETTRKGNGIITVSGSGEEEGTLLVSGHVDTLGAMVRSIKSDGMIRFTSIGGYTMHSVEGEYCTVHTREGKTYSGTILSSKPSVHVYADARTHEREEAVMEIRLDESVSDEDGVKALGIQVGDYISFDPRAEFTDSGYIKSRHLDDKAGVAVMLGMIKYMTENGIKPKKNLKLFFTTHEEVGHGSAYIPDDVDTILVVDMGAIGDDLTCTEKDVSICVKDSSGPYDYEMVGELIDIAKSMAIDYALDVYPRYSSDASAALSGGNDVRAALIGPGVHASHTMERTHEKGLLNTLNLLAGYVK